MVSEIGMEQFGVTVGSGAVLGGVLGYTAKKLLKLAVVLAVLEVGVLAFLERNGVLDVYWNDFGSLLAGVDGSSEPGMSKLASLAGALPIGASFAGGFLLGFKKG